MEIVRNERFKERIGRNEGVMRDKERGETEKERA